MTPEAPTDGPSATGADIHIHKPKPLHGVREFVGEVAVII